jgi:hypothetical protein
MAVRRGQTAGRSAPKAAAKADDAKDLALRIRRSIGVDKVVSTTLSTDERVIARVTDGIYRQPGSALRELISNAYDADATKVVIQTDAPRFERISIEDDGHGMTPEALAYLLRHIGGSAKRSEAGSELGMTSKADPTKSPGGRRLIGKIGIGLFSVSQLTHSFQINTKVKSDSFRTVATVALRQYVDQDSPQPEGERKNSATGGKKFESGKVNIWRERASDPLSHGTTIVLTHIRRQARDTLRSREIWNAIEENERNSEADERQSILPPRFHVGRVDTSGELLVETSGALSSLPWDGDDSPDLAFKKLVQAVWDEVDGSNPNPRLDTIFDHYLRMVWQLSLAIPLPYVEKHVFDEDIAGWAQAFLLSNQPKGSATPIDAGDAPLRQAARLVDPAENIGEFAVLVDALKLARPIKFKGLPTSSNALKCPLIFVGKCTETFSRLPPELSGGPLQFEAYLFWTPKVAPVEHQGSLIRIHGSSGTLFDPTFMRYQIAEVNRLRQITCEIFIREGLDSALNIDRESFNNAHPHAVYITKWLHNALRQLASVQKRLAGELREQSRDESKDKAVSEIQTLARRVWRREVDDPTSRPPAIELSDTGKRTSKGGEAYVYTRAAVVSAPAGVSTQKARAHAAILEEKLKAIAQVLASFGLLDAVPKRKQEALLRAIFEILEAGEGE